MQCLRNVNQHIHHLDRGGEVPEGDFGRTAAQLEARYVNEHPSYTRQDWRDEAGGGDTQLGYWDWVIPQAESRYYDDCDECGEGECDKVYVADAGVVCKQCTAELEDSAEVPSDADVAEGVGLHYKVNFDAEPADRKADWVKRYVESHSA